LIRFRYLAEYFILFFSMQIFASLILGQLNGGVALNGFLSSFFIFAFFLMSLWYVKVRRLSFLFGKGPKWRDVCVAILAWCAAFPCIVLLEIAVRTILDGFGEFSFQEQVAVYQMKRLLAYPVMFSLFVFCVVFIVPFIEELLFRGLLQGYLREKLSSKIAVLVTSLFFAGAHFAIKQRAGNVLILLSLFVFSLVLGVIYEKRRVLWTPIALHGMFNAMSVVFILFEANRLS